MTNYRCCDCGRSYEPAFRYTCECGGLLDVEYDYKPFADLHGRGLQRYADLLPIRSRESLPALLVGSTPLTPAPKLAAKLGLRNLFVKEDNRNPTGSFKDRASAVVVAVAKDLGHTLITGASTGNAASALAGLSAAEGIRCVIWVPATAPEGKIAQLLVYGAIVMMVEGTYDDACELSLECTRRYGWFNRNTGYNPVCLEGKKTVSMEIWEDLGRQAPDAVFVSVGDGCIIGGVGKGFLDLRRMGHIERLPRLYGSQAEGSSVLSKAFRSGTLVAEPAAATYADSICVGQPRAAGQALARVRESQGTFVVATDDEIRQAQLLLARTTGIFAEPAGATAIAGLQRACQEGLIGKDETVVAIITGHGLKDVKGAMGAVDAQPIRVPRDAKKLEEALVKANVL